MPSWLILIFVRMIEVLPKVLLLLHSLKKFVVKKEKNIGLTTCCKCNGMRKAWENRARKETPKDGRVGRECHATVGVRWVHVTMLVVRLI